MSRDRAADDKSPELTAELALMTGSLSWMLPLQVYEPKMRYDTFAPKWTAWQRALSYEEHAGLMQLRLLRRYEAGPENMPKSQQHVEGGHQSIKPALHLSMGLTRALTS